VLLTRAATVSYDSRFRPLFDFFGSRALGWENPVPIHDTRVAALSEFPGEAPSAHVVSVDPAMAGYRGGRFNNWTAAIRPLRQSVSPTLRSRVVLNRTAGHAPARGFNRCGREWPRASPAASRAAFRVRRRLALPNAGFITPPIDHSAASATPATAVAGGSAGTSSPSGHSRRV